MLFMLQWMASYIYAHRRNTKYTKWVRKKEEEQERRQRKWGEEVLVLKLQKGWERLSRDYREKVGDRYDLDTLYSCMKLVHSNFFKRKHKGPVRSTQFVTGSLIGSTEPGVEAFKNIRRVHKQLSGWIISRWEKLRWRKRKDV